LKFLKVFKRFQNNFPKSKFALREGIERLRTVEDYEERRQVEKAARSGHCRSMIVP